jgi:hypothetical protein
MLAGIILGGSVYLMASANPQRLSANSRQLHGIQCEVELARYQTALRIYQTSFNSTDLTTAESHKIKFETCLLR